MCLLVLIFSFFLIFTCLNLLFYMTTIKPNKSVKVGSPFQACSACKYQRRKCAPNCLLAPYFPPDRHRDFLNAHKLFGVRNISKTIGEISPSHRHSAMSSIIYQANARARDPVGGCLRIVMELQRRLYFYQYELHSLQKQLSYYKHLYDNIKNNSNDRPYEEQSLHIHEKRPQKLKLIADQEQVATHEEKSKVKQIRLRVKQIPSPSAEEQSSTAQLCNLADITEDIKPLLGEFERDNTNLFS